MRGRDYRRLARLSLKSRKKSTRQTIVGISFGLVLLFPLLFIALGFYAGFNIEVNKNPSFRTFFITYSDAENERNAIGTSYLEYKEKIEDLGGITNSISFNYVTIPNEINHPSFIIGKGKEVEMKGNSSKTHNGYGLTIIDEEYGTDPFLKGDYTYTKNPLYAGSTFSSGSASKGEIMLSTTFMRDFGLDAKYVVGQTITIYNYVGNIRHGMNISSSDSEINNSELIRAKAKVPYLVDFKIVGIYDSNIYAKSSIRYRSQFNFNDSLMSVSPSNREYFWITNASLGENGVSTSPERITKTQYFDDKSYTDIWYYYSDIPINLAKEVTNNGFAFIPYGIGAYDRSEAWQNYGYVSSEYIEFNSFASAKSAYPLIESCYLDSTSLTDYEAGMEPVVDSEIALPGFKTYASFYDIFLYICIALSVLGGVIFIATLLNLLNTLHFSVQSMKGFLGICRAEGLRSKGVVKLFLCQINHIFFIAYLFVVFLGGGICAGLKLLFDRTLQANFLERTTLTFTIEWWYIPIAFVVLLIITSIISVSFSRIVASKASKTPILDILSEENK